MFLSFCLCRHFVEHFFEILRDAGIDAQQILDVNSLKDPNACAWKRKWFVTTHTIERITSFDFIVRPLRPLHHSSRPAAAGIHPGKLSPLGGLTMPLPLSVPGLCPTSLGDPVPLPGTVLLSCGAAPCA